MTAPARPAGAEPGTLSGSPSATSGLDGDAPVGASANRRLRTLVLAAVFVCAACGLVYELALVALGSYLLGNTITQASVVLAVMVFAMGVGSLLAKRLSARPVVSFAVIELALGVIGGSSVVVLYSAFAWWSLYQPMLVLLAFVIGLLIGAEIPLLMTLLQQVRAQEASDAVADLFAADYVGALVGGLAFPFVLLPTLGLLEGAVAVGAVNALAGAGALTWLFRRQLRRATQVRLWVSLAVVCAGLAALAAYAASFELSARQQIFRDPVVVAERSPYAEVVVTRDRTGADTRLFLNGDLQFSSLDEYRYHEALIHPAMRGPHRRVLVLGGGDGLAAREVLRYPDVESVTLVDLDTSVTDLFRRDPRLSALNDGALSDPRLHVVHADAFSWLRAGTSRYDVVVADLPDADDVSTAKLYSVEFYGLARKAMAPGARLVVQAGSPYFAREAYWTTAATLRTAGLAPSPYHVDVPSFGDWGFYLAVPGTVPPDVRLPDDVPPLRYLDATVLAAALHFPRDRAPLALTPSTLLEPRILERAGAWAGY